MDLLNKTISCTLYFQIKKDELKSSFGELNLYTGSIKHKFSGNNVSHITFNHDKKEYSFELYILGGRYFMKDYEKSPFYRLFILNKSLPVKEEVQQKRLKI